LLWHAVACFSKPANANFESSEQRFNQVKVEQTILLDIALFFWTIFKTDCLAGAIAALKETVIPFLVKYDTDLLVHANRDGGKALTCVANLACDAAQQSGLTELSMDDHCITQVLNQDLALPYYCIKKKK